MERVDGMIGVHEKEETLREAKAFGKITLSEDLVRRIRDRGIPKGDVLEQSRVAGIIAAKKTPDLIPLCHPIRITDVKISYNILDDAIEIESYVAAKDRTGVEMEALSAVSAACLNIYDMCKKFDSKMEIGDIYLLEKRGGRSGEYIRGSGNQ